MADPKTPKPKTSKPKTPKAKPTPPGQGLMDFNAKPSGRYGSPGLGNQFNAIGARGFRDNPQTRAGMGGRPMVSSPVTQPGAPLQRVNNPGITRTPPPPRTGGSFGSGGNQATGRFREVIDYKAPTGTGSKSRSQIQNIVEPPTSPKPSTPASKGGSFGDNGVKRTGPFTKDQTVIKQIKPTGLGNRSKNPIQGPRLGFGVNGVKATGAFNKGNISGTSGTYSGPMPGDSSGRGNMGFGRGPYVKGQQPIINPGAPLERITPGGPVKVVDKIDDAAKIVGGAVKSRPKGRFGLLAAAAAGATALGAGYLMSRRNENEDAAKPQQAGANVSIPGRNAPPSSGNEADRSLYPAAGGGESSTGGGTASKQPTLTDRVRGNNKANRNPTEYLGEAFDATVKRGRDVGRKHLQGMLVRDSVDESTARNLIARYDKEIGSQRTLKDYKSEGIAQKFDRENPGKAGRILDEYRGMGRREGAAPGGATYAQIKERALR
jgi:hypothetical protein